MTQTLAQAEKLLDFSQPLDIGLLDATVDAFYSSGTSEEVCDLLSSRLFSPRLDRVLAMAEVPSGADPDPLEGASASMDES